jgi:hypothetical protein
MDKTDQRLIKGGDEDIRFIRVVHECLYLGRLVQIGHLNYGFLILFFSASESARRGTDIEATCQLPGKTLEPSHRHM